MDASSTTRSLFVTALCSLVLAACAHRPAPATDRDSGSGRAALEVAENNYAFARDQAALWLTNAKDRCAAGAKERRHDCEIRVQKTYEQQLADVKQHYDAICAQDDPRQASSSGGVAGVAND